ncbi:MAG: ATP-dependent helicase [Gemmatimonadota bacterium]
MTSLALNEEQARAVNHGDGPILVLAGAGSGKTRVLTARVARLIQELGVPPDAILAVTFTNKAAGVMRDRIEELLGHEPRGLWVGTFHSIAARLLRREGGATGRGADFTIYAEDESLRALKQAMEDVDLDPTRWSPASLRARISDAKNALQPPEAIEDASFDLLSRAVASVYPAYERILARCNALDFDDLLVHTVHLLEDVEGVGDRYARRFRHVLVDEYQDTNHAQYRMIRRLARGHGNVCVVGDDDQSIYGWRGADLRNILDFEKDFPGATVVRLEQNYRSTQSILDVANAVIARNSARKEKRLRTERENGEPVALVRLPDERSEATWLVEQIRLGVGGHAPEACVVLYRTNAQSRPFEDALRRARLPYRIVGGVRFYERREIRDILAYLQLTVNPSDDTAFARAATWPRRGVGTVTLERLREAAGEAGRPLLEMAEEAEGIRGMPPAGARALAEFAAGIAALRELASTGSAEDVVRECIRSFGVVAALETEEDGADRIANVTELLAAAAAFDPAEVEDPDAGATELALYLQSAALRTDIDDYEDEAAGVTLMTLHNAKGLEFPVVFVTGLEDGLFPLSRSLDSEADLEEERRLFYVGVTRAQDTLFLTHARRRWRYGSEGAAEPSRFLEELPEEGVERIVAGRPFRGRGPRRERVPAWRPPGPTPAFAWRRRSGAGSPETGGIRYDYTDSQVPLEIQVGARVVHPRFGEGEIVAVSGRGRATRAEIEFENGGRKKVAVAHAGLRPA